MIRNDDFNNCPICRQDAEIQFEVPNERNINCNICGTYTIDLNQFQLITTDENRHLVSGYTRNYSDNGNRIYIKHQNVEQLIHGLVSPKSPLDYLDKILVYIHENITRANDEVELSVQHDYSIFYLHDSDEFNYIIEKAKELEYIEELYARVDHDEDRTFRLTLKGWEKAQNLRQSNRHSDKVFVAMWFSENLNNVWLEGYYPTLTELGYEPVRIDQIEHNGKICDEIIAEINKSSLLIADFTGHRGGVYFEAGYAMGKNIPVIWTCRSDHIENAHFDTRQYNHITWDNIDELSVKLKNRIEATIL